MKAFALLFAKVVRDGGGQLSKLPLLSSIYPRKLIGSYFGSRQAYVESLRDLLWRQRHVTQPNKLEPGTSPQSDKLHAPLAESALPAALEVLPPRHGGGCHYALAKCGQPREQA